MSVRKLFVSAALAALVVGATPGRASADWLFTPFVGSAFGGNANFGDFNNFDDEFERRVTFGGSLGWMGAGIIGAEMDFGWTPNFFENTSGDGDFDFGDSNVTTLMGNLILGVPLGGTHGFGIRPYASGGIGLIKSRVDGGTFFNDLTTNDLGFNAGAGLHMFFSDSVGIKGDIRYFQSLQDDEPDDEFDIGLRDFHFWRASVGVTFRFGN